MSVISRLVQFVQEVTGPALDPAASLDVSDDRLAAAALLVHVARVDGLIAETEREALLRLLATGYGLSDTAAEALVARADRFDLEVDDVGALVEMLGHETHQPERRRLLAMAFRVAAADGVVQEFEADLLWRLGGLLGFDEPAVEAIRAEAAGPAGRI